jgi:hypothetical protein
MHRGLVTLGKKAGGFDDNIHAHVTPANIGPSIRNSTLW